MRRLRSDYPTVAALFDYNRKGTMGFLKANGALAGYIVSHNFNVPYVGFNDGVKV
jgi:hypothetical protein